MSDVIWTLIIVWLIFRVFSAFSNRKSHEYQKHEHHHYYKEGTINVDTNPNKKPKSKIDDTEYTDYEEIK
ncbi:MAG: hypothetical protein ACOVLD_02080 [Bacteroidia bacterium]